MVSSLLTDYADRAFAARSELLAPLAGAIDDVIAHAGSQDAATLLRYLYGTLPVTDCFGTDPAVLRAAVEHGLFLRASMPWTAALPEGLWVHFVLAPRINNEPLTDCRRHFYDELAPRVAGLDASAAVREVNYWCCEKATYESTDGRTLGPLAVLSSGSGRCGEESTFLVCALRSVGIPARQVYAPWWAHCDDNHAWVEAWADGAWHYLGACEPEEALDRGWFTNAAGRTLLAQTRVWSDFEDPACPSEDAGRMGCARLVNVTGSYARTCELEVRVSCDDAPAAGARVSLQILNMAAWMDAMTLTADAAGTVRATVGLGTLRVRAALGERCSEVTINTSEQRLVELKLGDATVLEPAGTCDLDIVAPADVPAPSTPLTAEQEAHGRARKGACDAARTTRVDAMRAHAAELAQGWPGSEEFFALSFGNADELAGFLRASADEGAPSLEECLRLLKTLAKKDFRDVRADLLESQLMAALRLRDPSLPADVFWDFVACPRVANEELSDWRTALPQMLGAQRCERFTQDPRAAWEWLEDVLRYDEGLGFPTLLGTPESALASGQASPAARAIAFVAICRALGVPARLNPESRRPEFWERGRFAPAQAPVVPQTTPVTLTCAGKPAYFSAWTLARLDGTRVLTLDLEELGWKDGRLELGLEAGRYRLISSTRLPNGNQLERECVFEVADEPLTLEVELRQATTEELFNPTPLPAEALAAAGVRLCGERGRAGQGQKSQDRESQGQGSQGLMVLAFTDAGAEPTEHLVNELAARTQALEAANLPVELLDAHEMPEGLVERLARRTYVNPEALPLTLLVRREADGGLTSLFASAGYRVGTVDLLLRLAALA